MGDKLEDKTHSCYPCSLHGYKTCDVALLAFQQIVIYEPKCWNDVDDCFHC